MPRLNNASELFKFLDSVDVFRIATGTFGDTVTTSALARAAATVPVSAITNFSSLDPLFIVGDGGTELNSINGTPSGLNIVPLHPITIAQSSGARVVEAVRSALGHVAEDGATFGGSMSSTPINAATSRVALAYFAGPAELTWSFTLLGHNNQNLLAAFGATETETGAGTSADPHTALIDGLSVGTQGTQCFRLKGRRNDGKSVWVDLNDAIVDVNASVNMGASTPSGMALAGKCTSIIQRIFS